jgi:23S rRNA pseudouridine1911/1915/1917 synthase
MSWAVEDSEAGLRLDGFLARRQLVASASAARRAVAAGIVRVNGRAAKKGVHLQPGDVVDMGDDSPEHAAWTPTPELTLSVLYSDENIVAVDKPAGLPTHPLHAQDAPTLAHALVARFPECGQSSPDPREGGLAHRLDLPTSGVLLAARQRETWYRLREALAAPSCEKIYLAEVRGRFPSTSHAEYVLPGARPESFVVTAPIGRLGRRGNKVKVAAGRQPLPARTDVTLLEAREGTVLVEARLSRGRAHQVRAHLAHLGIPVFGDPLYGEVDVATTDLRLHAWSVELPHPLTGKPLRIESPLPSWARRRGS